MQDLLECIKENDFDDGKINTLEMMLSADDIQRAEDIGAITRTFDCDDSRVRAVEIIVDVCSVRILSMNKKEVVKAATAHMDFDDGRNKVMKVIKNLHEGVLGRNRKPPAPVKSQASSDDMLVFNSGVVRGATAINGLTQVSFTPDKSVKIKNNNEFGLRNVVIGPMKISNINSSPANSITEKTTVYKETAEDTKRYNFAILDSIVDEKIENDADDSTICVVCYENKRKVLLDCGNGHICSCAKCTKGVLNGKSQCPICRQDIKGISKFNIA